MDGPRVGGSQGGNSGFWESADVIIHGGKALRGLWTIAESQEWIHVPGNPYFSDVQMLMFLSLCS